MPLVKFAGEVLNNDIARLIIALAVIVGLVVTAIHFGSIDDRWFDALFVILGWFFGSITQRLPTGR